MRIAAPRVSKRLLASALLLLASFTAAFSDAPVRTEQLIWSVIAFNGSDYSPTFVPGTSDTIYLLADAPSILSARMTFVYWWPITSEWRTDTDALNVPLPGTLEVHGGTGPDPRDDAPGLHVFQRARRVRAQLEGRHR